MEVVAARQCDVVMPGDGHVNARKRALFAGETYEIPECDELTELLASGAVRSKRSAGVEPEAPPAAPAKPKTAREVLVPRAGARKRNN